MMLVLISCLSVSVLPTLSDSLCCLPRSVMKSVTEHLIITNKNDCINDETEHTLLKVRMLWQINHQSLMVTVMSFSIVWLLDSILADQKGWSDKHARQFLFAPLKCQSVLHNSRLNIYKVNQAPTSTEHFCTCSHHRHYHLLAKHMNILYLSGP